MAPEQLESNEATPRSDVYSLGLVLVEMLTGRLPWGEAAGDQAKVGNALLRLVTSPSTLRELQPEQPYSEELLQLASDVLSRDPKERPEDAGALLRRIRLLPEMREWQRLPRRLSWPAQLDATTGRLASKLHGAGPVSTPAASSGPPTVSGITYTKPEAALATGEPSRDSAADYSTAEQTAPDGSQPKSTWSLSSGVPESNDDWAEPTIPAVELGHDYDMRSLVATLVAESRQARGVEVDFSADSLTPVARPSAPPTGDGSSASQRALPAEDPAASSSTSTNRSLWSALDLNQRLDAQDRTQRYLLAAPAVPELVSEEPTEPSASPPVMVSPSAAAAAPVLLMDSGRNTAAIIRPAAGLARSPRRSRATWFVVAAVAAVGLLGGLGLWFGASRPPTGPVLPPPPISQERKTPDGAAGSGADLAVSNHRVPVDLSPADLTPADLGTPPDLAPAAPEPKPAEDGTAAAPLRVRFVYAKDDGISAVDCDHQQVPAKSSGTHKVAVKMTLGPGALCTVSGSGGTRNYTYDQLSKIHPDHAGEIRVHIRGSAASSAPGTALPPGSPEAPPTPAAPTSSSTENDAPAAVKETPAAVKEPPAAVKETPAVAPKPAESGTPVAPPASPSSS